jgi:2-amino-4-hydroxy-6-hydroxymethyldihydropteridine diphosphokinase
MADGNSAPVDVFLSAGSNIDPEENLRMACRELSADFGELTLSSVYQNEAVGFDGEDFLNMVIGFSTCEDPERIVERLEELHDEAGRERQDNPFSSRTLDLDILLYGDLVRRRLKLPREDIEKYGFVLGPLAEVAPEVRHPVSGLKMQEIWEGFDRDRHPMQKVALILD